MSDERRVALKVVRNHSADRVEILDHVGVINRKLNFILGKKRVRDK